MSIDSAPQAGATAGTGHSQPDPLNAPHHLNKVMQDAWDTTGSKMLFSRVTPGNGLFKEDQATRNQAVMADKGVDPISLAYALNGRCHQNYGKRQITHCALTRQEMESVAAAATPSIPL
jgi:hypothetical protein